MSDEEIKAALAAWRDLDEASRAGLGVSLERLFHAFRDQGSSELAEAVYLAMRALSAVEQIQSAVVVRASGGKS